MFKETMALDLIGENKKASTERTEKGCIIFILLLSFYEIIPDCCTSTLFVRAM